MCVFKGDCCTEGLTVVTFDSFSQSMVLNGERREKYFFVVSVKESVKNFKSRGLNIKLRAWSRTEVPCEGT